MLVPSKQGCRKSGVKFRSAAFEHRHSFVLERTRQDEVNDNSW
jgi:hypothetical protein